MDKHIINLVDENIIKLDAFRSQSELLQEYAEKGKEKTKHTYIYRNVKDLICVVTHHCCVVSLPLAVNGKICAFAY